MNLIEQLDGDKKVYLKSIVNSPRQDEFIVVDYLRGLL